MCTIEISTLKVRKLRVNEQLEGTNIVRIGRHLVVDISECDVPRIQIYNVRDFDMSIGEIHYDYKWGCLVLQPHYNDVIFSVDCLECLVGFMKKMKKTLVN